MDVGGVRIEPNCCNVVSHRTYFNPPFNVIWFRCFRQAKMQTRLSTIDDFWQHHCPTKPNFMKTGDAGRPVYIEFIAPCEATEPGKYVTYEYIF